MTLKEITSNSSTKFIDVRSKMEFNDGHINGAVNIPLDEFVFRYKDIQGLGETPFVFYCRSGNRSEKAVNYLNNLGYTNIYDGGGMSDLINFINE